MDAARRPNNLFVYHVLLYRQVASLFFEPAGLPERELDKLKQKSLTSSSRRQSVWARAHLHLLSEQVKRTS